MSDEYGPHGECPGDTWAAPTDPQEDQAQALAQEMAQSDLTVDLDQDIVDVAIGGREKTTQPRPHWLSRTKRMMEQAGMGHAWIPGSTTWRDFMPLYTDDGTRRHIAEAVRRGWLGGYGIPQLTIKGYLEIP